MGKLVQEIVDSIKLPYPLNLPDEERLAALRAMTPGERLAIGCALSDEYRRRWLEWLRRQFPTLGRLLEEGEEERQIAARRAARARNGAHNID
jgi:hypothetical protein